MRQAELGDIRRQDHADVEPDHPRFGHQTLRQRKVAIRVTAGQPCRIEEGVSQQRDHREEHSHAKQRHQQTSCSWRRRLEAEEDNFGQQHERRQQNC